MSLAHDQRPHLSSTLPRHDWTREEVRALFALPFPELMFRSAQVHRENFDPTEVQISTLLSIKTGGCQGFRRLALLHGGGLAFAQGS